MFGEEEPKVRHAGPPFAAWRPHGVDSLVSIDTDSTKLLPACLEHHRRLASMLQPMDRHPSKPGSI